MRRLVFIAALALFSRGASAQCNIQTQIGCPGTITSGVQAGTTPSVTAVMGVTLSANFGGLGGDVCYPTGKQATAPILIYFHPSNPTGSPNPRTVVWTNISTAMTFGLCITAMRTGFAVWSVDYTGDTVAGATIALQKSQSARCAVYKILANAGTTSYPGNPNMVLATGASQGGTIAVFLAQTAPGYVDACDNTPVAIPVYRIWDDDGGTNWAQTGLTGGGLFQYTSAPIAITVVENVLNCVNASQPTAIPICNTNDVAVPFSPLSFMPLASKTPFYYANGSADTYCTWSACGAATVTTYGSMFQGTAQLPGDHMGDSNNTGGVWWPVGMYALANAMPTAASGGTGSAGSY